MNSLTQRVTPPSGRSAGSGGSRASTECSAESAWWASGFAETEPLLLTEAHALQAALPAKLTWAASFGLSRPPAHRSSREHEVHLSLTETTPREGQCCCWTGHSGTSWEPGCVSLGCGDLLQASAGGTENYVTLFPKTLVSWEPSASFPGHAELIESSAKSWYPGAWILAERVSQGSEKGIAGTAGAQPGLVLQLATCGSAQIPSLWTSGSPWSYTVRVCVAAWRDLPRPHPWCSSWAAGWNCWAEASPGQGPVERAGSVPKSAHGRDEQEEHESGCVPQRLCDFSAVFLHSLSPDDWSLSTAQDPSSDSAKLF